MRYLTVWQTMLHMVRAGTHDNHALYRFARREIWACGASLGRAQLFESRFRGRLWGVETETDVSDVVEDFREALARVRSRRRWPSEVRSSRSTKSASEEYKAEAGVTAFSERSCQPTDVVDSKGHDLRLRDRDPESPDGHLDALAVPSPEQLEQIADRRLGYGSRCLVHPSAASRGNVGRRRASA